MKESSIKLDILDLDISNFYWLLTEILLWSFPLPAKAAMIQDVYLMACWIHI